MFSLTGLGCRYIRLPMYLFCLIQPILAPLLAFPTALIWPFASAEKAGVSRGWVLSIQWSHLLFSTCDHNHLQSKQSPLYLFSKGEKSFTHVHNQFLKDLVEGLFERFNCPINVVQFV
jgi:hypothetical protein